MICFYLLKQIFDPRTSLSFSSSTFFSRETWLGHFQNLKFTSVPFNSVLFWVFTRADDVEMFCCCCWEMRTLEWIPCFSERPQCCLERYRTHKKNHRIDQQPQLTDTMTLAIRLAAADMRRRVHLTEQIETWTRLLMFLLIKCNAIFSSSSPSH